MISLAQAAFIFRTGGIEPAEQLVAASLSAEQEKALLVSAGPWRLVDASDVGVPRVASLKYRTALVPDGGAFPPGAVAPFPVGPDEHGAYAADNLDVVWWPINRLFWTNSARAKVLIGFHGGGTFGMEGVLFHPKSALQNWSALVMTLIRGRSLTEGTRSILLSAHGLVQNTGMTWLHYGPPRSPAGFPPPVGVNLILGQWGTSPLQAEGVAAEFVLPCRPGHAQVFALDSTGARKAKVPVTESRQYGGRATFEISAAYQTLWYEIEINPPRRRR
jgi:hypothetical protein